MLQFVFATTIMTTPAAIQSSPWGTGVRNLEIKGVEVWASRNRTIIKRVVLNVQEQSGLGDSETLGKGEIHLVLENAPISRFTNTLPAVIDLWSLMHSPSRPSMSAYFSPHPRFYSRTVKSSEVKSGWDGESYPAGRGSAEASISLLYGRAQIKVYGTVFEGASGDSSNSLKFKAESAFPSGTFSIKWLDQ